MINRLIQGVISAASAPVRYPLLACTAAINTGINNALSGYLYTQGGGFGGGAYGIRGSDGIY